MARRTSVPTVVRIFTDHAATEATRQAMLNIGLTREYVALSHRGDGAGALCGNLLCGNYEPGGESAGTYERRLQNIVIGKRFVLTSDAGPVQVDAAEATLQPAGRYVVDGLEPQHRVWPRQRLRCTPPPDDVHNVRFFIESSPQKILRECSCWVQVSPLPRRH